MLLAYGSRARHVIFNLDRELNLDFDLAHLSADFFADPYPVYARLQDEAPVHALPGGGFFLTRYDDLQRVYRDTRLFSSDKRSQFAPLFGRNSPLYEHHTTSLVFNDPPLHTRVRRAIGNALSRRLVETMQGNLEQIVARLLERLEAGQSVDLIEAFAAAIPVEIIGNLLGVPQAEREPLRRWSLAILGALEVDLSEAQKDHGNQCVREFLDYLERLVAQRRAGLSDADDDIMARLLRWEEDGYQLDGAELYHQCIFLLNAGHETTTNLIGNSIELLLRFPDMQVALRREPELMDGFIEESLRFESPNQLGNRTVTADVDIDGVAISRGAVLTLAIGAANRDPAQFVNAQRFDPRRSPNPHLAFGAGIHTCAGLHVARLEARIALSRLLERFPELYPAEPPQRARRARFRGFIRLPVRLG